MIKVPRLNQLPYDTLFWGGVGFALSKIAQVNESLSVQVFAIAAIANNLLFVLSNETIRPFFNAVVYPYFKISDGAVYLCTSTIVSTVTILACQSFDLISRRVASSCIFTLALIFTARFSLLNEK